ncbi:MAG: N-acyl-L-amino acid amidohydrolase [Ponticaulis sp.]|nr:N-acyl-L-amino acid amidohydrolase [Ponticaulis sp.]
MTFKTKLIHASLPAMFALLTASVTPAHADSVDDATAAVQSKMVEWRRDFHENPELSNREFRTAGIVADELRALGLEVTTDIAVTGVVGVLKGDKPGPVIAFRADMDALPMPEETGLPFASRVTAEYNGSTVPVAHACGHDAHTAILLGAASILSEMKSEIAGTILFVFQPAEEGAPWGETGGAARMLAEGVFDELEPEAMFALHVEPGPVGKIYTRPTGFLAGATAFKIDLEGEGTHAAKPWSGTDLPSLGADIIKAFSVIAARKTNTLEQPNVLSVGRVTIGTRNNILPADGVLEGTLRTYSEDRLSFVKSEVESMIEHLGAIYGATTQITYADETPPTVNTADVLARIAPALEATADLGLDADATPRPAAEDFSFFSRKIPSVYFILGSTKNFESFATAPSNHSPQFDIDESVLAVGAEAFTRIALLYSSAN